MVTIDIKSLLKTAYTDACLVELHNEITKMLDRRIDETVANYKNEAEKMLSEKR